MKNKNVFKLALVGALVGIVVFDIISIVLYLVTGLKIGLENTACLITCYIFSAAYIPLIVICMYYCKKIELSDMSLFKRTVYTTLSGFMMAFIPIIAIAIMDMIFKLEELIILMVLNIAAVMLVTGIIDFVIFIKNKGNVKEINKKIKEKVLEEK